MGSKKNFPLLGNGYETWNITIIVGSVFSMRSMPRLHKESVWCAELVSETETEEARFEGETVGRNGSE